MTKTTGSYVQRLAQYQAMSKQLLNLVSAANAESRQKLTSRLDNNDKNGNLCNCELKDAVLFWRKKDYFLKSIAPNFNTAKFLALAASLYEHEYVVDIKGYLKEEADKENPPKPVPKLDPNDPDYYVKRFNLIPHGHGCTLPERREGQRCTLPEYQTQEEKEYFANQAKQKLTGIAFRFR